MASARSSGSTPACAVVAHSTSASAAIRLREFLVTTDPSRAAATAARATGGALGAFTHLEHVIHVRGGHRIRIYGHDGIGQMLALVGLHPGLDGRAGRRQKGDAGNQQQLAHGLHSSVYSRTSARIWSRYSFSSPGL